MARPKPLTDFGFCHRLQVCEAKFGLKGLLRLHKNLKGNISQLRATYGVVHLLNLFPILLLLGNLTLFSEECRLKESLVC